MNYDLKIRYNVMKINSLNQFLNIKGGINNNYKDVYFIRIIGTNNTLFCDIENADKLFSIKNIEKSCYYNRISKFPIISSPSDIEYYSKCYEKWIENGKNKIIIDKYEKNDLLETILGNALNKVLNLFNNISNNTNKSIEKNFLIKLLYYFDKIWFKNFSEDWNLKNSIKLIIENISKKQEYLFCYFLTLIGTDILLLQYKKDITNDLKKLNLSNEIIIGEFYNKELPLYSAEKYIKTSVSENKITNIKIKIPPKKSKKEENKSVIVKTFERNEMDLEELANLASSVVMISILDENKEIIGTGSGIMIGEKGYILTNSHVAMGGVSYCVRIENDENIYYTNEIIKYNYVIDLALIRINKKLIPLPIYEGKKELIRGQKVAAIGSPLGFFNSFSNGIISGFRNIDGVDMIQFTAPISPGSSGGAVLNMFGEVIGISTAGVDIGQNINLAVGYKFINDFIKGFK